MILSSNNPVSVILWRLLRFGAILNLLVALPSFAAPKIECKSPKYDFGTQIGQEKITHEFVLWNRGSDPVRISKIKNCCGVKSSITPMEILPGSNAVCKTVFTTRNRYGKQDKQILIASNDRRRPYFELKMTGTLLRPVEFSPRLLRLGVLYPDSSVSQTITASNLLERAVVLESVKSTIPGIVAEVADTDRISALRRSWTIQLRSSEPLRVGKLNGQIVLNFSSGRVKVLVMGTVKPIIQVVPEQIQFSSRSSKATERLVMLRSGDGRSFEVLSAKLSEGSESKEEKGEGSVEIKKLAEGRWQLKLVVVPNRLSSASALQVQTSCKSQPTITVPLVPRREKP